jgi:hypothetical protein
MNPRLFSVIAAILFAIPSLAFAQGKVGPYTYLHPASPIDAPVAAINPPPGSVVIDTATGNRYIKVSALGSNATYRLDNGTVYAHAATADISAYELYGGTLTNTGASGAVVLTLPAPVVGMRFRVYLTVAQDVDINAATGTQILVLTNATGDAISSAATIGNSIELVALSSTTWGAFATSGTWTDVN